MVGQGRTGNGFAQTQVAIALDVVAQRYSVRPSTIMGIDPLSCHAPLYDFDIMKSGVQKEAELKHTTGGSIELERAGWPDDIKKEIREQKMRREALSRGSNKNEEVIH